MEKQYKEGTCSFMTKINGKWERCKNPAFSMFARNGKSYAGICEKHKQEAKIKAENDPEFKKMLETGVENGV